MKFDVIILEPPLDEYQKLGSKAGRDFWSWEMIQQLNIPAVADWRCFLWLWCGSGPEGLNWGRHCFRQWGFRRCEDICWIKTNLNQKDKSQTRDPTAAFQRTKEHCLMGIKGTVKRSTDGDFIHANVDIDLIISDEPEYGSIEKPTEIFLVAEHFCLGRRRLHLFGRDDTLRNGWLTVGPELTSSNFDLQRYKSFFETDPGPTTGCSDKIEQLRPKSPPPKNMNPVGGPSGPPMNIRPGGPGGAPPHPAPHFNLVRMPNAPMASYGRGGISNRGRAGFGPGWHGRY